VATTFVWKGMTPQGEALSGEMEAASKEEVAGHLRKQRVKVKTIRAKVTSRFSISLGGKVKVKDMSIFTRQFSTMINAGLPIVQCLDILSKQTENETLRRVVSEIMLDVEGGNTLATSMGRHKTVFTELYSNMVDAGESGGILDIILARLAVYLEKADALQRKVKSAMTYPAIVAIVAGGATIFMLMFVIPVFAKMFSDFGGTLPAPTRFVMGISVFLRNYWWALGAGVITIVFIFKRIEKNPKGKYRLDKMLLGAPVIGDVIRKGSVARFTRTLGTLVGSGVPILQGLDITGRTAGNKVIEEAIMKTRHSISQGDTISEPLRESGVFPPMVVQMIAVGEQTGALDEMLSKIADFYDDEVDTAVEQLTSVIEPIMIVVMGIVVGGMLIAMYLPMFKMAEMMGG
jgi:type IV pilus assembly protein PilC